MWISSLRKRIPTAPLYLPSCSYHQDPPFEPLGTTDLRSLSLKTALASVKRAGDLQALSVEPSSLEFGPNNCKVVLGPRIGYMPKVLSTLLRMQVIVLSALLLVENEQAPQALMHYI